MRRRGSYQAICHPRGITPPWLTSLRTVRRFIMGGAPPGPFPRRVRAAPPRRVLREANACVHVTARESFAAWVAASQRFRRAPGFAFRLDCRSAVEFGAARSDEFVLWCCFSLNRSFSGRDFVRRCETAAEILVVRSAELFLWLGFDDRLGRYVAFQMEDARRFPQRCEYLVALYLLFLLLMDYLSGPQSADPHSFHADSLRSVAGPAPQLCVPSPQTCGPFVRHLHFQVVHPAGVSSLSECVQLRRLVRILSRCMRSGATSSSNAPAFAC